MFFKQKTAYDLRISDWSSDVCSSDLFGSFSSGFGIGLNDATIKATVTFLQPGGSGSIDGEAKYGSFFGVLNAGKLTWQGPAEILAGGYKYTLAFENLKGVATGSVDTNLTITASAVPEPATRSEEHTSELQSLMRISYAVFCLKTKTSETIYKHNIQPT